MKAFFPLFNLLLISVLLSGCISYNELVGAPGATDVVSPVIERQSVVVETPYSAAGVALPPAPNGRFDGGDKEASYRVDRGDVLLVNVDGRPELSSPGLAGGGSQRVAGSRIDGEGHIRLPMVGRIGVAGMTLGEVEDHLQQVFSRYLVDPWVTVEIAEYRSQPIYLLGQFKNAGTYYLDRPHSLLAGLSLGGGTLDSANLRSARLIRDNQTLPVDIYRLLREGAVDQNILLQGGDTLFVPDDKNQNVFVFGAVSKPGAVVMANGRLNLSQALAAAGVAETRGRSEAVRIIRSHSPTRGELIIVDHNLILNGRAVTFALNEGDIVYVPLSAIGSWNQAIQDMLPSLQAVSAILQPFVSIKYLTDD